MKTSYQHIIFDLDGTLSDSREGIFNAYKYTFEKMGLKDPGPEILKTLIGPTLQKGFRDAFGLEGEKNDLAIKVFRDYYAAKGLYENALYDGMKELIEELYANGVHLYVATSKYNVYARKVLQHFGILDFFTEVSGADYEGKATKVDLIAQIIRDQGITDPTNVVVIGDTRYDIDAATELALDSIGVTYGFSTTEELISYNPDYIAHDVNALHHLLINSSR
jgi:phosphoglycolate phosphatase